MIKIEHIVSGKVLEIPEHHYHLYEGPSWRKIKVEKEKTNVEKVKRDIKIEPTELTKKFDDNLTG